MVKHCANISDDNVPLDFYYSRMAQEGSGPVLSFALPALCADPHPSYSLPAGEGAGGGNPD